VIPVFDIKKIKDLAFVIEERRRRRSRQLESTVFSDEPFEQQDVISVSTLSLDNDIFEKVVVLSPFKLYIEHKDMYQFIPESKGKERLFESIIHNKMIALFERKLEEKLDEDDLIYEPVDFGENTKLIGLSKDDTVWGLEIEMIPKVNAQMKSIRDLSLTFAPLRWQGRNIVVAEQGDADVTSEEFDKYFDFVDEESE
jgi:hypothetical protein